MTASTVKVVPRKYNGQQFRSTLEAWWACTLDWMEVAWTYELETVDLPVSGWYLPDFYLPEIRTFLEVKGGHDERLEKTQELARVAMADSHVEVLDANGYPHYDAWSPRQYVVVGRTARTNEGNYAMVFDILDEEGKGGQTDPALATCNECGKNYFLDFERGFDCRACGAYDGDHHLRCVNRSGEQILVTPHLLGQLQRVIPRKANQFLERWNA